MSSTNQNMDNASQNESTTKPPTEKSEVDMSELHPKAAKYIQELLAEKILLNHLKFPNAVKLLDQGNVGHILCRFSATNKLFFLPNTENTMIELQYMKPDDTPRISFSQFDMFVEWMISLSTCFCQIFLKDSVPKL